MGGAMSPPALPAWQRDKGWAGKFTPWLKSICGQYLIGEAPEEDDAGRNTDLIVLKLDAVRIACRVRKHQYLKRYCDEFTIRSSRPSGTKTEFTKIIEGWGDYILYGFASADERSLAAWVLGDLKVFRRWAHERLLATGRLPGEEQENGDGSSLFRAFRIAELPTEFVIGRKLPIVEGETRLREALDASWHRNEKGYRTLSNR